MLTLVLLIGIVSTSGQDRVSKAGRQTYEIAFIGQCDRQFGICRMRSEASVGPKPL